ncbi:DUF973 family protein [Acidianus sulfidivorans JP7]|uniref:Protein kinase domain-containing protein n=1 Tax=Acidianus sulfidivorans JP7 TaxID=619593 RepID=A0A2U9IJE0_9CREN|nr:DUF973 family protein [Acidianus sulfidivorans]AWR96153.1 DUF973 family protein [Acidianus sulfidivorans JP7]
MIFVSSCEVRGLRSFSIGMLLMIVSTLVMVLPKYIALPISFILDLMIIGAVLILLSMWKLLSGIIRIRRHGRHKSILLILFDSIVLIVMSILFFIGIIATILQDSTEQIIQSLTIVYDFGIFLMFLMIFQGIGFSFIGRSYDQNSVKAGGLIVSILSIAEISAEFYFSNSQFLDSFVLLGLIGELIVYAIIYKGLRRTWYVPRVISSSKPIKPKIKNKPTTSNTNISTNSVSQPVPSNTPVYSIPSINIVGEGTVNGNGIAELKLFASDVCSLESALIEGTQYKATDIRPRWLDKGENSVIIRFYKNIPNPSNTTLNLILTVVTKEGNKTMERITATYIPSLDNWDPKIWINREISAYKVKDVIGTGGTSFVLLGEKGDNEVAIKIPKLSSINQGGTSTKVNYIWSDIMSEPAALMALSQKISDYVITLSAVNVDKNIISEIVSRYRTDIYLRNPPYIIMEYMKGGDLDSFLRNNSDIIYSEKWEIIVAYIIWAVSKALETIHNEGYVHLDVKPRNVFFSVPPDKTAYDLLISLQSGRVKVKLGDLGSAKKKGSSFTQATFGYCPVDQVKAMLRTPDYEKVGAQPSMDIFALGATAYRMLTGKLLTPTQVINLMNQALDEYTYGRGNFIRTLDVAYNIYKQFYSSLNVGYISSNSELSKLILDMVNFDPGKRPSAEYIEKKLCQIYRLRVC